MSQSCSDENLAAGLARCPEWNLKNGAIIRSFRFPTFREAFAFMTSVAALAEEMNHHPDWSNSYNRVEISLSTHSADGLTELDFALAERIDAVASGMRD